MEKLAENVSAFLREMMRLRPSAVKGTYVRSLTLSSTMGPGIRLDISEVVPKT